ncbi:MBL fold metallo-hydrolase [Vibrio coralliilyticus]|uniref:MBL fold metallo-hydrolase n=1 Tax=Vibrio coralliilyticus TaxID=190893 RepID=UPI0015615515|nr:MBL fold metallo-hydrolase [Vibrio coralliilyticus]NRF30448.1 MBL fold metallo-hydrolase [Vibrio coralliilyticus]NRF53653.1 MBL fold metallo-hydrolase [Vibrio coralliilyticus]NRG05908.1 MBL fold metallo-hydrolase [Vibrio coralliilyticus]
MSNRIKALANSALGVMGLGQLLNTESDVERQQSERLRAKRIFNSKQFNNGKVVARMPNVPSPESMSAVMWKFFFQRASLKPQTMLPHIPVNMVKLAQRSDDMRVTWLGHSSLFIDIDRTRILIDPVFEHASPWVAKKLFSRNVKAPVKRDELPLPDAIVISHDHYDHLEESTIRYYADKDVVFMVPLAVGRHLEKWGVSPAKIQELDWWESTTINGVKLTAAPANHNSGRTGFDSNSTLWASWAIHGKSGSLFYSGDSAYDTHFKEIGKKLGPFDMAFIEVAANVKEGKGFPVENWGHMQARHTMQAFMDLGAEQLFPVHWSTFELFAHKWDEPMTDLIEEAKVTGARLVTPMVGETLELNDEINTSFWWKNQNEKWVKGDLSFQN